MCSSRMSSFKNIDICYRKCSFYCTLLLVRRIHTFITLHLSFLSPLITPSLSSCWIGWYTPSLITVHVHLYVIIHRCPSVISAIDQQDTLFIECIHQSFTSFCCRSLYQTFLRNSRPLRVGKCGRLWINVDRRHLIKRKLEV